MTSPTYVLPPKQLITTALHDMIEAALPGFKVGDHKIPSNPSYPYGILYALDGGREWGSPLHSPEESVDLPFQVSIVGNQRAMVQLWQDKLHDVMLGRSDSGALLVSMVMPEGWIECGRLAAAATSGVQVSGSAPKHIYTVPSRYTVQVTPA